MIVKMYSDITQRPHIVTEKKSELKQGSINQCEHVTYHVADMNTGDVGFVQFDEDSMEKISSPSSLTSSTPSLSSSLTSSKGVEKTSLLHQMTPQSTASMPGMSSSPSPFHPSLPALKLGNDKVTHKTFNAFETLL